MPTKDAWGGFAANVFASVVGGIVYAMGGAMLGALTPLLAKSDLVRGMLWGASTILVCFGLAVLGLRWYWERRCNRQLQGRLEAAEEGNRQLQGRLEAAEEELEAERYRSAEYSKLLGAIEEERGRENALRGAATAIVATCKMMGTSAGSAREEYVQQICGLRSVIYEYLSEEQRGRDHPLARACGEIAGACADKKTAPNKLEGPIRTLANLFGLGAFMPPSPP